MPEAGTEGGAPSQSGPERPAPPPTTKPAPVSTYRVQLRAGFGFAGVAGIAGYLARLGISNVYLSPILAATPGSAHGYDVIDHSRVSPELGGESGFRAMVATLRQHGLGVVVDVVPNHMAMPVPEMLNRQLWSVLADGPASPYARWFDVDWPAGGGRFLLPILGGTLPDCLTDLKLDPAGERGASRPHRDGPDGAAARPVLRYFDHVLPVRAGTQDLPLTELLDAQHYRLAYWRDAATRLNWRRFFDITSLIAVRVEDPDVFAATHQVLLRLLADGLIDGLRVDHPDGLADPRGYLRWLAEATGGAWIVTEKILSGREQLPPDWPCAGTTGYDARGVIDGLFLDHSAATALTTAYRDFTGGPASFADVAREAKREAVHHALAAELSRLARLAAPLLGHRGGTGPASDPNPSGAPLAGRWGDDLRTVLAELLTGCSVYRAYVVPGEPPCAASVAAVNQAAASATRHLPSRLHPLLAAVHDLVLGRRPGQPDGGGHACGVPLAASHAAFMTVFQQTCGPVMAKGVEDTAFYRWSRLTSLNEVGGEPGRLGVSPREFHAFAGRLARDWPHTMTTLSTHDTKRQEDVRARLAALAGAPQPWADEVAAWHDRAIALTGGRAPEPDTEYMFWQTLAGAWPVSTERMAVYLRKAMREAKTATSWTDPDERYEAAVLSFSQTVLADPALTARIGGFVAGLAPAARANTLGAKLVQLTMPGVPDVYQGCELTGYSLVDPDNRRPVDYELRRQLLQHGYLPGEHPPAADNGAASTLDREKLLVTSAALWLRRDHPDWFTGDYQPLPADGPAAGHAVAFIRGGHAVTVVTRLASGLAGAGGWADTVLPLPAPGSTRPGTPATQGPPPEQQAWLDVLSGLTHAGPRPPMSDLTRRLPVALLVPVRASAFGTARREG